jgi:hypothetical protein
MTRINACVVLLVALGGLSGCGLGTGPTSAPVATAAASSHTATGVVHGGQNPVSGAAIQLWAVGTTGYGSAAAPLIGATLTTSDGTGTMDSNANSGNANNTLPVGSFTITGDYTCPTATTLVYLTATGGNPGLGGTVNNSAIVMLAALGQCGSLSPSTYVVINELTTAGTVEALAPFLNASGSIGSALGLWQPPGDRQCLRRGRHNGRHLHRFGPDWLSEAQYACQCDGAVRQLHRADLVELHDALRRRDSQWRHCALNHTRGHREHRAEPHPERHRDLQPLHPQRPIPACFDLRPRAVEYHDQRRRQVCVRYCRRRRRRLRHGLLLRHRDRPDIHRDQQHQRLRRRHPGDQHRLCRNVHHPRRASGHLHLAGVYGHAGLRCGQRR